MVQSFYFYDLETSGISSRSGRIMQFGGQRTDMNLKPIGPPDNILIKLTDDVLPDPEAVLIHGIAPQKTKAEGLSEAQFAEYLTSQVSTAGTIIVGFNNIRFDDEFIRYLLWRNFHDPYEWQWKNDRSRWDLLDVVRMTRALRPENIKWPFASDGKATVRLELLASINKLTHDSAHDALSDVHAEVAVARLIKKEQPKLFDYLLNMRNKIKVQALVGKGNPLIYTSGRYPSEYEKTTVAVMVTPRADRPGALMYDLRVDPDEFIKLSPSELARRWSARGEGVPYFPIKVLSYNKSPTVAPLSVLDSKSQKRLGLELKSVNANLKKLGEASDFGNKLIKALDIVYPKQQPKLVIDEQDVDEQLYDGFVSDGDRIKMSVVRAAGPEELSSLQNDFSDERLKVLLPLYKARNFPESLNAKEQASWETFRTKHLTQGGEASQIAKFWGRLKELENQPRLGQEQKSLLGELKLYANSILPHP